MLANLKYPVGSATTKHSGSAREALFADAVAESLSSTRPSSVRLDERTVDIAVSELAAEFEPAPAPLRAARESVLDVDVQMDRAAGRFQAFEVLTIDQTTTRTPTREEMREAEAAPTAAANDFGWSNQESASDENAIAFHPLVQMQATAEQNPSAEGTSPLAYLYTLVDEQIGVTWNRAFALVVFGLIAYAFRLQHQSRPQVSPAGEGERAESPPPRHSGWLARYFKFASRIRAAASS
jgi:hypothetical protein